jgi:hypothetical protein
MKKYLKFAKDQIGRADLNNIFYKKDKFCDLISKRVESLGDYDSFSDSVDSNDVPKCDRRIHYVVSGGRDSESFLRDRFEYFSSKKWADIFGNFDFFEVLGENRIFADQNYGVSARVDFFGKFKGYPTVVIVKSSHSKIDRPTRPHVVDCLTKMWLAEVNNCFLIYDDVFNFNFSVFRVLPNKVLIGSIKEKLRRIKSDKLKGNLPDRKYSSPDSRECLGCGFKKKCWEK